MARVVVIGAGLGGLAAAARLHAQGHSVVVCEQAGCIGGKLGTYEREGFRFDTGPSLLTLPGVFRDLFAATGDALDETLDLERLDPNCRYRFADGTSLDVPADRQALVSSIDNALGSGAGAEWEALLERASRIWDVSRGPFLESPGPPDLLRLARQMPTKLPVIAPGRSLRWLARKLLADPRLQTLLERYATYAGSDPRRAPAALASTAFVEQEYGCWYVRGGLYRLAEALAARLPAYSVRTGAAVTTIETAGGKVSGVRLHSGARLAADIVVADVDATHLYTDLVPRERLVPPGEPSSAGFVLLLGLRERPPGLAHHTVLFPPVGSPRSAGYAAEFDAIFAGRLAANPTIYVSAPVDTSVSPTGAQGAFVLVNAPRQGPFNWDAPGVADSYGTAILTLLAERGLELRDKVIFRETRTPADLARATGAPGGAIYGMSSHGRAAFKRAANRSPVPGLFLTGGSAHPGGGLPLVALSARAVAGLIGPA